MEGRLLFAPDPFLRQKWQGYKVGMCSIKGPFLNIKEKNGFLMPSTEEYSIPLEGCTVQMVQHPKKHLFEVVTSAGSKYNFISNSTSDVEKWIVAIKESQSYDFLYSSSSNNNNNCDVNNHLLHHQQLHHHNVMVNSSSSVWLEQQQQQQQQRVMSYSEDLARKAIKNNKNNNNKNKNNNNNNSALSLVGRKKTKEPNKYKKISSGGSRLFDGVMKRCGSFNLTPTFFVGNFGVPLQFCRQSIYHKHVPLLVVVCTKVIEKRGIDNQGLYRVPGNSTLVNSLCHELTISNEINVKYNITDDDDDDNEDDGGDEEDEDERWADVNVVSSLLKLFFRKLPEPLITTSLYRPAIDAIRHATEVDRVRELKKILHKLPIHHFETFKYLSRHLRRVALKGDSNKMTANNISIVFGPTLICSREEHDVNSLIVDMPDQCRVVEACINHVENLFSVDADTKVEINGVSDSTKDTLTEKSEDDGSLADGGPNVVFGVSPEDLPNEHPKVSSDVHLEQLCNFQASSTIVTKFSSSTFLVSHFGGDTTDHLNVQSAPQSRGPSPSKDFNLSSRRDDGSDQLNRLKDTIDRSLKLSDVILNRKQNSTHSLYNFKSNPDTNHLTPSHLSSSTLSSLRYASAQKVRKDFIRGISGTATGSATSDEALQHLKRLSLDMRAFKHKHELMKPEQEERCISKERIEKEYQKTLSELDSCERVHF